MSTENIDKEIAAAESNLAALKKEKEKLAEESRMKKGDYLVCISTETGGHLFLTEGKIYIVISEMSCHSTLIKDDNNDNSEFFNWRFRKANSLEITQYQDKLKEAELNFKSGEYVIYKGTYGTGFRHLTKDKIYVTQNDAHPLSREQLAVKIIDDSGDSITVYCYHFRRATSEEIVEYNKPKYKIGDKVIYVGDISNPKKVFQIVEEGKIHTSIVDSMGNYHICYKDKYRLATPQELKNWDETIFVNGYPATFDFQYKIVNFGCAAIHFQQIEKAYKFLNEETHCMYGVLNGDSGKIPPMSNRTITSVKIGTGEFTFEILRKIINKINENIQVGDWVTLENYWDNKYYKVYSIDYNNDKLSFITEEGIAIYSFKDLSYKKFSLNDEKAVKVN